MLWSVATLAGYECIIQHDHFAHHKAILSNNIINRYIRVKRRNQTFFIHTSPSDSFAYIKEEICKALGGEDNSIDTKSMRLYIDNKNEGGDAEAKKEIPDAALLSDHNVKNDDIIMLEMEE